MSLALVTSTYFAVNDIWNDLRVQTRFGEHWKGTKKYLRGPNSRAEAVGFLWFQDRAGPSLGARRG